MNLKFQIIAFLNILKERPLKIQTWTAKAGTYSKNSSFNIDQLTTSKPIKEEQEETSNMNRSFRQER